MTQDFRGSSFRSEALSDWRMRLLDIGLHAVAAVLLPGPWWLQYVPDAVLPVLWGRAVWRDRFDDDRSALLRVHRLLHLHSPTGLALVLAVVSLLGLALRVPQLHVFVALATLHASVHAAIDMLTHDGRWQ